MLKQAVAAALLAATVAGCAIPENAADDNAWRWLPYGEKQCTKDGLAPGTPEHAACAHEVAKRRYVLVTCSSYPVLFDVHADWCARAE